MQRITKLAIATALLAAAVSAPVRAQSCAGTASFAAGRMRVGAGATFGDGAQAFGAQLAAGQAKGAFAGATLSRVDIDDVNEGATAFGGTAGYGYDVASTHAVQLCPTVGFGYTSGPKFESAGGSLDFGARSLSAGVSLGGVLTSTSTLSVVPFAGLSYVNQHSTMELRPASGEASEESSSEDFALLDLGAGFVLNQVMTIRPMVSLPMGLEDAKTSYGIGFSFNFGHRLLSR